MLISLFRHLSLETFFIPCLKKIEDIKIELRSNVLQFLALLWIVKDSEPMESTFLFCHVNYHSA